MLSYVEWPYHKRVAGILVKDQDCSTAQETHGVIAEAVRSSRGQQLTFVARDAVLLV